MSESNSVFNQSALSESFTENVHGVVEQPSAIADGNKKRHPSQQPRQLLSCTKCRERKVKCDRTKPCSACCARGKPKECQFKVSEGGDYAPIQQSYELRKLRSENLILKERLRQSNLPTYTDEADQAASPDTLLGETPTRSNRRSAAKQKRFQGSEWSDSIYFGSPGLANVINEFASTSLDPVSAQSLTHAMPRGADMYAPRDIPAFPFPTLFPAEQDSCIDCLLHCLPERRVELPAYLDAFQKRALICAFPHIPVEITKGEVDRYLSDARNNVQICPDMLALLFAALALGSQHCVWDKYGQQWKSGAVEEESKKGGVYMAASMQALRLASFMSKPSLLSIQALIMIGPYLTNSGRFLDAWTLFGTTIRLAQAMGLHRHPKYLDPAPPTDKECSVRQSLWWWMLHMDQQYSMTLGRPLGISGIGDCPPPHELTTDPTILRFGEFVNHFTILARRILSSDRLTNARIDEFTDELRALLDTMPENLQFNESWLNEDREIPEWPHGAMAAAFYCKIHNYLILLNRQRLDKPQTYALPTPCSMTKTPPPSFSQYPTSSQPSPPSSIKATLRGRPLVLASSEDLLTAFLFFNARVPAALICWTMGQKAFNSCMILILDALETHDLSRIRKVEHAFAIFQQLDKNGVHKIAGIAVSKISWGLAQLYRLEDPMDGSRDVKPSLSGSGPHQGDVQTQGAVGSEAAGPPMLHDSVMGNNGMELLEGAGLQSFLPEPFKPLTWDWAVEHQAHVQSYTNLPLHRGPGHGDEQGSGKRGEQSQPYIGRRPSEVVSRAGSIAEELQGFQGERVRISEKVQGLLGSTLGSAPVRYATMFTAPPSSDSHAQCQPQGLDSPMASPVDSLSSTTQKQRFRQQQQDYDQGMSDESQQTQQHNLQHNQQPPPVPPPRHHSYPPLNNLSLHQHTPLPLAPRQSPASQPQSPHYPASTSYSQPPSSSLMTYHNFSLSPGADVPSSQPQSSSNNTLHHHQQQHPQQLRQTFYRANANDVPSSAHAHIHANANPPWSARPAAPISTVSEPGLAASGGRGFQAQHARLEIGQGLDLNQVYAYQNQF
ncbi:fungal-specific transcription factor domain-domain-containing protein [Clohesyomyces aquaticus]|uniref:Fungal-specific transcription factor domain-domain-containing protein n=1 Tax=Clohesyomyces aquaticus TaxID=1231657 RepID=A0A1Y1YFL6_9PLEO|nr:fungal-specific transcription factor domain-domain-containing protein [Clohesyomyces aquaticus]